jgi:flagellar M-ring protein FliF
MGILTVLAAGLAGLAAIALWTQQPDFQVLFANLAADDAASIVEKLRETKVPYEVAGGGATILVPSPLVHDLRLQLAGQGLPHGGGVGFEIFDRSTVGMSEFIQKLNYRRALQGELARTITQLPEVERARVHLAVPERRLFSTERDRPRASVVLSLRRNQTLSKAQVQGIVHLVASSVEGLQPQEVTVVDGHGRLLSDSGNDGTTRLSGSQLDYQRGLEKDIETRIQTMLEKIVGAGKATVRISSVLDFRQVELTEERFDPNSQVVRSEQRSQEKSNNTSGSAGGVPGAASNVPSGQAADNAASIAANQNKNETINYEINRTVARVVEPVGTIKKLSAAVLIDGTYGPKAGEDKGGEGAGKYVARTPEEMKQFEELVIKAMGYSAERGDQVEVLNVPFRVEAEPEGAVADATPPPATVWAPYVRYGVGAFLFAVLLIFVVRPLVKVLMTARFQTQAHASEALREGLPMTVGQAEAALTGPPPDRAQIVELARTNPQSTAMVVKGWLKSNA